MLNTVTLVGNLVKDPELRTSPTGSTYTSVTLANENGGKTIFIEAIFFGRSAEIVAKYFRKGRAIGVTGRLAPSKLMSKNGEKRDIFNIICDRFDFINVPVKEERDQAPTTTESVIAGELDPIDDDDTPF